MGRSKFPGKPSKLASKKRIRILSAGQNGVNNWNEESLANNNGNNNTTNNGNANSPSNSSSSCINQVGDTKKTKRKKAAAAFDGLALGSRGSNVCLCVFMSM